MAHIMDARMMMNVRSVHSSSFVSTEGSDDSPKRTDDFDGARSTDREPKKRPSSRNAIQVEKPDFEAANCNGSRRCRRSSRRSGHEKVPLKETKANLSTPNLIDLKSMSAEVIEWEGYLYRQRKLVKSWTPRYATLKNGTVTFYKSKAHAIAKSPVRGKWDIREVSNSVPSTGFGGLKLQPETNGFTLLATDDTTLHLIASSCLEKTMWVHHIKLALTRVYLNRKIARSKRGDHTVRRAMSGDDRENFSMMDTTVDTADLGTPKCSKCGATTEDKDPMCTSLSDRYLIKMINLLTLVSVDEISEHLPSAFRQLSKDVELLFDIETTEVKHPSCIFKGVYYGREGFAHFISLYQSKYVLTRDMHAKPSHKTDKNGEFHSYVLPDQRLINNTSGSKTGGNIILQLTFTPARRINRVVFAFRRMQTSPSRRRPNVRSVSANPMVLAEHPPCFHQAYLSKRSLALTFSDFDVVGVLGQGGFGTVILVRLHHSPEELFAIKIIDKHSGAETALKERRILNGVHHPFLVCLRFAFQTQTKLYLGMDYYKGGNLYLHMHSSHTGDPNLITGSGSRFSVERARFYAAELAIALFYLHSCGIIYRDLKPDNVMLDKTGHIRLVDFGLSKQLQYENDHYTPTGTLAGSPAYIAPEQLSTQKPRYGMEADWWSYGILLYEMLTGRTPFADNNISTMYRKIQSAEIVYDSQPKMDALAVDLLQKLLVREPTQRIKFAEIKAHPFFAPIDWERLEMKDIVAPFVPSAKQLMDNVHAHFRNMNVGGTLADRNQHAGRSKPNNAGPYPKKAIGANDFCHFDEFSFSYDTERDSAMSVNMADNGWLIDQLRHGAELRGILQSNMDDADIACVSGNGSNTSGEDSPRNNSRSSDSINSSDGSSSS
uniref:Protein kinase putative n=1 Tax=Albugo laibachii Nc14 TaxID=890382 RepID=F0WHE7_9STRA|nr:protein kinase putative [Albugo laibachii Nc14]|eukprot:CCA20666.1 protein kinase putative [Albugo laibachii Nc14]